MLTNTKLKIITSMVDDNIISVDLSVLDHTGESTFYRNIINKINKNSEYTWPEPKVVNYHNLEEITNVLKDRECVVDGNILGIMAENILSVVEMCDEHKVSKIIIEQIIKLKRYKGEVM